MAGGGRNTPQEGAGKDVQGGGQSMMDRGGKPCTLNHFYRKVDYKSLMADIQMNIPRHWPLSSLMPTQEYELPKS